MPSIIVRLGQRHPHRHAWMSPRDRRWQVYELAKRHWDAGHPDATPRERDAAIAEITRRLGL